MKIIFVATLIGFTSQIFASNIVIADLKNEIMNLARTYEGRTDQDGKLQNELEQKVQDLEKVLPYLTMQEKAQKIGGAWRQVFGPYSPKGDGTIPVGTSTANIYQIIFPQGIFYNVALSRLAKFKAVILLKGKYQVTDEAIEAVFTRNSILLRGIPDNRLYELAQKLEAGEISPYHLPSRLKPVGLGGQLLEVYADDEVRILRGKTESFVRPALYIMEKAKM